MKLLSLDDIINHRIGWRNSTVEAKILNFIRIEFDLIFSWFLDDPFERWTSIGWGNFKWSQRIEETRSDFWCCCAFELLTDKCSISGNHFAIRTYSNIPRRKRWLMPLNWLVRNGIEWGFVFPGTKSPLDKMAQSKNRSCYIDQNEDEIQLIVTSANEEKRCFSNKIYWWSDEKGVSSNTNVIRRDSTFERGEEESSLQSHTFTVDYLFLLSRISIALKNKLCSGSDEFKKYRQY